MPAIIYGALQWAMGGLIQTLLVGAGLSLVTYTGLSALTENLFNLAISRLSQVPSEMLQFALLFGVGDFLNIVISATLTRVAIDAAVGALGIKKAGQ